MYAFEVSKSLVQKIYSLARKVWQGFTKPLRYGAETKVSRKADNLPRKFVERKDIAPVKPQDAVITPSTFTGVFVYVGILR